jgi:hypothetical protein
MPAHPFTPLINGNATYFIIAFCVMADNFTCEGESADAQ